MMKTETSWAAGLWAAAIVAGVILAGCGPEDACEEVCEHAASADCGGIDVDRCTTRCRAQAAACSEQDAAFDRYLGCLTYAEFACGGITSAPVAASCTEEALPLYTCLLEAQ